MIVKNEEKYLEKCLNALKPLLNAIPSELIIVDTGSTDKTVEIAESFTDKVYHFEWVNDFAAARNFGLEKCKGEWFMFIDADEIFNSDLSEMLDFFCDRQALDYYKSATYMIRNLNADGSEISKFRLSRIVKKYAYTLFLSPIHEYIDPFSKPTMHLNTITNHYGYAHETEEEKAEKKQRNLVPLREHLKQKPDDLRSRVHVLNDLEGDEFESFMRESLTYARKNLSHPYSPCTFTMGIKHEYTTENFEKALTSIDEFFKLFKNKPRNMLCLDILAAKALSLLNLDRLDEAIEAFDEYFRLYNVFLGGRLDDLGWGLIFITYCEPEKHAELTQIYHNLLLKTGRKTFTFSEDSVMKIETVSRVDSDSPREKPAEDELDENEWLPILEALKNNTDMSEVLEKSDPVLLGKYIEKIAQSIMNLPALVIKYSEQFLEANIGFAVILFETATGQAGRLPWDDRRTLYRNFAKYISLHIHNIYKPESLTESNVGALPEVHRYGYYVSEALQKLDAGDSEGYVAILEKAKSSFKTEMLIWAVEFLIEDIQE
jgi:glycosyltransferase involved in cell wall biosynthesis